MSLRRILFEDIWLKLFALVVAVSIYAAVSQTRERGREIEKTFFDLPVGVLSTSNGVSVKLNPSRVHVTVRGDVHSVQNLQVQEIRPVVDLAIRLGAGSEPRRVVVFAPSGVTPVVVRPGLVEVTPATPPISPPRP